MVMTKLLRVPPRKLDKFTVSPVGDKAEYARIRALAHATYAGEDLIYIGMDIDYHYFQVWGEKLARLIERDA